jgi:Ran GTPase-activating protein 1
MAASSSSCSSINWAGKILKITTADDAKPIIDSIHANASATSITLSGNTFGTAACAAIADALASLKSLRSANLSDIFTTRLQTEVPPSIAEFTKALTGNTAFEELNLSDNAVGKDGVAAFISLFKTNPDLKHLHINNCGLGSRGATVLARGLVASQGFSDEHVRLAIPSLVDDESVPPSSSSSPSCDATVSERKLALQTLVAGRNRLENIGASALARALHDVTSLTRLEIPQNGILPEGIAALSEALAKNTNLQELNLNDNTIKPAGAVALAAALTSLPNLRRLNLGDCMLGSQGVITIAKALASAGASRVLEVLDLSYCDIDDAAAKVLADAVRQQPNLLRLELNGNAIKAKGLEAINEALGDERDDVLGSMSENEDSDDDDEDDDDDNDDNDDNDSDDEQVAKVTEKLSNLNV